MTGSSLPAAPSPVPVSDLAAGWRAILDALSVALLGALPPEHPAGQPGGPPQRSVPAPQQLRDPALAAAFGPGATVSPAGIGPGIWAVRRTSHDATVHVLCVHNIGDRGVSFDPALPLPGAPHDRPLMFLAGQMQTRSNANGGVVCDLPGRSFAWIACGPAAAGRRP